MSVWHAMLALLSEGPQYGLRLREEFEDRTGEAWPLNVAPAVLALPAHRGRVAARGRRAPARGDHVVRASPRGVTPSAGLTRGHPRVPDA